jgi:hypothetical protein
MRKDLVRDVAEPVLAVLARAAAGTESSGTMTRLRQARHRADRIDRLDEERVLRSFERADACGSRPLEGSVTRSAIGLASFFWRSRRRPQRAMPRGKTEGEAASCRRRGRRPRRRAVRAMLRNTSREDGQGPRALQ